METKLKSESTAEISSGQFARSRCTLLLNERTLHFFRFSAPARQLHPTSCERAHSLLADKLEIAIEHAAVRSELPALLLDLAAAGSPRRMHVLQPWRLHTLMWAPALALVLALANILLIEALAGVDASAGSTIYRLNTVGVVLGGWVLLGEQLRAAAACLSLIHI